MTVRYERARNVLWMADELRARHPVLHLPVRKLAIEHVLREDGIVVTRAKTRARAYVDGGDGTFVITARQSLAGEHLVKVLLHEYAHIHLHLSEHGEVVRQLFPCRAGDPREAEADLLAALLWFGEDVTPDHPVIARLIAKVDAPRFTKRPVKDDPQLQLGVPTGVPMYKHPAGPAFDQSHGSYNVSAQWAPRRPRDRMKGPRIRVGDSHDSLLFDWSKNGKPLGYFHLTLGWMDIWDTMPDPSGKEGKREILVCGDRRAAWRDFVITTADRRRYEFADHEKRSRRPKDLDRQLERARHVKLRTPISAGVLFRARSTAEAGDNDS